MTEALVAAREVRRGYSTAAGRVTVVDGASLAVRPGELVLLLGPSGSGKTTLLSLLAGLLRPDAGQIDLAGQPIDQLAETAVARIRRREVGFVFQSFHLFEALTARDNVAEALALRGTPIREARIEAIALLEDVGLGDRTSHLPSQLSAGQKQRVALARAFAGTPRVIFADEPTTALDAATGEHVLRLLREHVTHDRCAVVVAHDVRLRRFADRVLTIVDGRIEETS
jgi:putative ABC transport system ATP-binding protein